MLLRWNDKFQQVYVCVLHLFLFVTNPNGGRINRDKSQSKSSQFCIIKLVGFSQLLYILTVACEPEHNRNTVKYKPS